MTGGSGRRETSESWDGRPAPSEERRAGRLASGGGGMSDGSGCRTMPGHRLHAERECRESRVARTVDIRFRPQWNGEAEQDVDPAPWLASRCARRLRRVGSMKRRRESGHSAGAGSIGGSVASGLRPHHAAGRPTPGKDGRIASAVRLLLDALAANVATIRAMAAAAYLTSTSFLEMTKPLACRRTT